ncbi:excisionase family DNA-binding protein [Eubacteriales bacterium OttesenSCG-928-A19]|nr:excisionase family DNA-binding protein [Eubacteriales bacterium OttesenSCG-928-A19]
MKFMTVADAAKLLGVCEPILRRGIKAGRYPAMKVGRRTLIEVEAAAEIVARDMRTGISIQEVSDQTGLAISAIRRGIVEGWIPAWKRGTTYQFDPEEVRAALLSRMTGKAEGGNTDGEKTVSGE